MDALNLIGFVIISAVTLALIFSTPTLKWLEGPPKNREQLFAEGYAAAQSCLDKGKDATTLYNQCQTDDAWDRGWKQACSNARKHVQ